MKKIIFLLFMINTINSFGQEDLIENEFVQKNLNGKIKSIVEIKFSSISYYKKKGKEPESTKHIYTFNEENFITKIQDFYENGESFKIKVSTNNKNKLINISQDFPNKVFKIIRSYKYNDSNQLIEKKLLNEIINFKYNSLGQLIEKTTFFDDKTLKEKILYKYIENKKIATFYDFENKINLISETVFDSLNREIEIIYYLPDGKTISSRKFFEYDYNGNLIKYNPYNDESISVAYSYKYDAKGNWTEKIELRNGVEEEKIIRTIEY